ncbi:MAG: PilN domain-containing protein [Clostridia bacterium]
MIKDINLLPPIVIRQRKSRERTKLIILLSILAVVSIFSLMLIPLNEIFRLEAKKEYLQHSMFGVQDVLEDENILADEQDRLELRMKMLNAVQTQDVNVLNIIQKTEELIPGELFFMSLTVTENNVNIAGVARSEVAVADFIRSMRQLGLFDKVFVSTMKGNRPTLESSVEGTNIVNYQFNMNCTLKSGKDTEL